MAGETVRAADVLAQLPRHTWTVLRDLRWSGPAYANVSHVVVGPRGVFVVDTRDWAGRVEVRDGVLCHDGRSREDAVVGAAEAALAVAQQTRAVPPEAVQPVLCFVGDDPMVGWARDVLVCSTGSLFELVTTRPVLLSTQQIVQLCLDLHGVVLPTIGLSPGRSRPAARPPTPR